MKRRQGLTVVLIVAVALATAAARGALERRDDVPAGRHDLLYLPNGKYLRVFSLGHRTLLADAIYLWAIQFYSDYEREDRYRYVEHVFSNVITELDPHYVDAYWLGSLILIAEAGRLEAGLSLLEKGMAANPTEWILPYLAAFECYRAEHYDRAAAYFARAADVPGAAPVVRRLRAGMFSKKGDLEAAIELWGEILVDPNSDPRSVTIARRQVRDLQVTRDIARLDEALERFRNENGRYPESLAGLVEAAYVVALPRDPDGQAYSYDARTGRVSSSAGRVLGGS